MEITGCDNVIFTTRYNDEILRSFFSGLRKKWPTPIIDVAFEFMAINYTDLSLNSVEELLPQLDADQRVELFFLRDKKMRTHMSKHAYAPDRTGEGPFAIYIRSRAKLRLEASPLAEFHAPGRPDKQIDPYPAWICSPLMREVTIVTPDHPDANVFSKWLHETMLDSCA